MAGTGLHITGINQREVDRIAEDHILELTIAVLDEARRRCPVGRGPTRGQLRASLDAEVDEVRGRIVGRVFTNIDYATYVHDGRGPVRARPGRVLGPLPSPYPRFVRRVRAARGQPFLLEALQAVSPYPVTEGR